MKKLNLFNSFFLTALISASLLITSCDKDDDDDNTKTYTLSGTASGTQEVPAVTTTATGNLTGNYNDRTNVLNYTITWTGLSGNVSVAHFHGPAVVGAEAGPIHDITIGTNGMAGTTTGSITLADTTESHLLNGKLYYNLHTVLNPDGEIRGQVTATQN